MKRGGGDLGCYTDRFFPEEERRLEVGFAKKFFPVKNSVFFREGVDYGVWDI